MFLLAMELKIHLISDVLSTEMASGYGIKGLLLLRLVEPRFVRYETGDLSPFHWHDVTG
jgi:hypothetical protein